MKPRKFLNLFFIVLINIVLIVPNLCITTASSSKNLDSNTHESHLIQGISYVAQSERNFCVYACFTMILNHMGLNTSINELLFYSGVGYRHSYSVSKRLPSADIYRRFDFLYSVYGVSSQSWSPSNFNVSKDELWGQYYTRVKENITKDIPVVTRVDPFSLPSLRNQFKVNDDFWNIIFQTGGYHVILIIGYNDTNQTICYNAPTQGFMGMTALVITLG
jgi:hypothetical protein